MNALETVNKDSGELVPVASDNQLTTAQSRVNAVAHVLSAAMAKSSLLELTDEQVKTLKAPFGDECFRYGAAGKDDLIYIEHFALRNRMDEALGMGKWALIRTRPQWVEDYQVWDKNSSKWKPAHRVYADCALVVMGCYVAEAIGDMSYFPDNASMNFGDAAEGAQTQAFRRCAKQFGVGLQAWSKTWCEEWQKKHPKEQGSTRPEQQKAEDPATPKTEMKAEQPKKIDPLIVKINAIDTLDALATAEGKWKDADKTKYAPERVTSIEKAILDRKLELLNEAEANAPVEEAPVESATFEEIPGLDSFLAEPIKIPLDYKEWEEVICQIDGITGIEKWRGLIQTHVILNPSMLGKDKKKITDLFANQEKALKGIANE